MDYSSVVFSYAFGDRSNSVFNLPVRWLLSLDYWLRFIDENCFDIVALVPYVCVRRGKELTDLLYARHRTIDY
jgi:hypothetical protein